MPPSGSTICLEVDRKEVGLAQIGASLRELLWKATSVFVLFAAIDYARQRNRYMKQLRMSKQEIKEEVKEMEGNPQVRGKIKRMPICIARINGPKSDRRSEKQPLS